MTEPQQNPQEPLNQMDIQEALTWMQSMGKDFNIPFQPGPGVSVPVFFEYLMKAIELNIRKEMQLEIEAAKAKQVSAEYRVTEMENEVQRVKVLSDQKDARILEKQGEVARLAATVEAVSQHTRALQSRLSAIQSREETAAGFKTVMDLLRGR